MLDIVRELERRDAAVAAAVEAASAVERSLEELRVRAAAVLLLLIVGALALKAVGDLVGSLKPERRPVERTPAEREAAARERRRRLVA